MRSKNLRRTFCLTMPLAQMWIAGCALLFAASFTSERATAASASQTIESCRATIGRPVVRACIQQKLQSEGGFPQQHLPGCRATASPAVRSCFQTAMKDVIAGCRNSVGKPIVEACVQARIASEGRFFIEQVQECRKSAFGPVRACVWRTSANGG